MTRCLARLVSLPAIAVLLAGCATPASFHEVLLPPDKRDYAGLGRHDEDVAAKMEMNPHAPLILIGVEKRDDRPDVIAHHRTAPCDPGTHCVRTDKVDHSIDLLDAELRQFLGGEPSYVSHIVQFRPGADSCALYNAYPEYPFPACPSSTPYDRAIGAYDRGWDAVLALERPLRAMIDEYRATHVVLLSTGWNNLQWQSIWTYRTWAANLAAATPRDMSFRPVYVAFSWKSRGETPFSRLDLAGLRSNDASEVGYVWAGLALHRVVRPLAMERGVKVVAIGHSYGAKLLTSAALAAPLHDVSGEFQVAALIGLQPAFSANRFARKTGLGALEFRDYEKAVGKIVLTSSEHDWANGLLRPIVFLGGKPAFDRTQGDEYKEVYEHGIVLQNGTPDPPVDCRSPRILLLDATSVVSGHTQVDHPRMAHLEMAVIAQCAR